MTVIKPRESRIFHLGHVEVLASRTDTLARSLCSANRKTAIYNNIGCSVEYRTADEPYVINCKQISCGCQLETAETWCGDSLRSQLKLFDWTVQNTLLFAPNLRIMKFP